MSAEDVIFDRRPWEAITPQFQAEDVESDLRACNLWHWFNKTLESPQNRVCLGKQVNSYAHWHHYKQSHMTPLFGRQRVKCWNSLKCGQCTHETKQMMLKEPHWARPGLRLSAVISEVGWYVNLIPLLAIWRNQSALILWRVLHAISDPFQIIWREAALSLDTSMSQHLLIISATTIAMCSPCWRASLEAINSASQVDLAIRYCLLDRHWTRLPPFLWCEVIPW